MYIVGQIHRFPLDCRFVITFQQLAWTWICSTGNCWEHNKVPSKVVQPRMMPRGPHFWSWTSFSYSSTNKEYSIASLRFIICEKIVKWSSLIERSMTYYRFFQENLEEFLRVYRSTPLMWNCQLSLSELLHNQRMHTRLIGFPDFDKVCVCEGRKMEGYQAIMKAYTDLNRGAKTPKFSAGDYMRISLPRSQPKGAFGFGHLMHIKQQVGPSSFKCTDGTTWNVECLTLMSSKNWICNERSSTSSVSTAGSNF